MTKTKPITIALIPSAGRSRKLTLNTKVRSVGVLLFAGTEHVFDCAQLRRDPGAKIITNRPQVVCWALGLHYPDKQVAEK